MPSDRKDKNTSIEVVVGLEIEIGRDQFRLELIESVIQFYQPANKTFRVFRNGYFLWAVNLADSILLEVEPLSLMFL